MATARTRHSQLLPIQSRCQSLIDYESIEANMSRSTSALADSLEGVAGDMATAEPHRAPATPAELDAALEGAPAAASMGAAEQEAELDEAVEGAPGPGGGHCRSP